MLSGAVDPGLADPLDYFDDLHMIGEYSATFHFEGKKLENAVGPCFGLQVYISSDAKGLSDDTCYTIKLSTEVKFSKIAAGCISISLPTFI